ncbi:hypothetical protein HDU98_004668, partial [Podochytrium sp. JEL0797]
MEPTIAGPLIPLPLQPSERRVVRSQFPTKAALTKYKSMICDWNAVAKKAQHAFASSLVLEIASIVSDGQHNIDYGVLVPLGTADADIVTSCKARDGWDIIFTVDHRRTAQASPPQYSTSSDNSTHQKLVDLEQKVRVLEAKLAAETHAKEEALGKLSGLAVENEEMEERVSELEAQLFRKQQDITTLQKKDAAAQRAANLVNRATLLGNKPARNRLQQQIAKPSETPDASLSVLPPQENVAKVETPQAFPPPHSPAKAQPVVPSG